MYKYVQIFTHLSDAFEMNMPLASKSCVNRREQTVTYIHRYIYIYVYMYICIYIHTYAHLSDAFGMHMPLASKSCVNSSLLFTQDFLCE